ncbi:MAG: hypothetical protein AAB499_03075 [Patescibacteria group bacterium]|mgnify:FL=1
MVKRKVAPVIRKKVAPLPSQLTANLAFSVKEFPYHQKNHFWYLGITMLLLVVLLVGLRYGNYTLALVAVALALAIFRVAKERPRSLDFRLSVRGVYWGKSFFAWHKLKSFWLDNADDRFNLYLEPVNFSPLVHIVLPTTAVDRVVEFLADHLPFHYHRREPLGDKLNRWLKI